MGADLAVARFVSSRARGVLHLLAAVLLACAVLGVAVPSASGADLGTSSAATGPVITAPSDTDRPPLTPPQMTAGDLLPGASGLLPLSVVGMSAALLALLARLTAAGPRRPVPPRRVYAVGLPRHRAPPAR